MAQQDPILVNIEKIRANDESLTTIEFIGGIYRLKEQQYTAMLSEALSSNTKLKELHLKECGLTDSSIKTLAPAISANKGLILLDFEKNKISSDGAIVIAEALKTNEALKELILLDNQRFGDSCVHAFIDMFELNVTLIKITWRLECRTATRLNSFLTRNREIERRLRTGKDISDIDPRKPKPIEPSEDQQ